MLTELGVTEACPCSLVFLVSPEPGADGLVGRCVCFTGRGGTSGTLLNDNCTNGPWGFTFASLGVDGGGPVGVPHIGGAVVGAFTSQFSSPPNPLLLTCP